MTDRAKLADAIDPRKLVPDSVMGGCTFIIDNADLIAASDALRAMEAPQKDPSAEVIQYAAVQYLDSLRIARLLTNEAHLERLKTDEAVLRKVCGLGHA